MEGPQQSSMHAFSWKTVAVCYLAIFLALVAAIFGLIWPFDTGFGPSTIITLWGDEVTLHGKGLYRHDTPFNAGAAKGSDAVTLLIAVPVGILSLVRLNTLSLTPSLLLMSVMTWILYANVSMAFGAVAYNELFLLYIATYSVAAMSLVAIVLPANPRLFNHSTISAKRSNLSIFLAISGAVTFLVWIFPLIIALTRGDPPHLLAHYSGPVTSAIDLGIITPSCLLAAWLVYRRVWVGILLAVPLLFVESLLFPLIAAQTIFQLRLGIVYSKPELLGPFAGFLTISFVASIFLWKLLREIGNIKLGQHTATINQW